MFQWGFGFLLLLGGGVRVFQDRAVSSDKWCWCKYSWCADCNFFLWTSASGWLMHFGQILWMQVVILKSGLQNPQIGLNAISKALSQRGMAKKIQVCSGYLNICVFLFPRENNQCCQNFECLVFCLWIFCRSLERLVCQLLNLLKRGVVLHLI